jgi:hypothetical protein
MPVWNAAPIDEAPELRLARWSIRKVQPRGTRHLVGFNLTEDEGRVSSTLTTYDPKSRRAMTESGRVYELVGRPGHDSDAEYVWRAWLRLLGEVTWHDVTDDYVPRVARGD